MFFFTFITYLATLDVTSFVFFRLGFVEQLASTLNVICFDYYFDYYYFSAPTASWVLSRGEASYAY